MPLPEHTVKLPQGIAIVDGKPFMTPAAILYVVENLTDEEAFELTIYPEQDLGNYCERATQWLFEHGKVSV